MQLQPSEDAFSAAPPPGQERNVVEIHPAVGAVWGPGGRWRPPPRCWDSIEEPKGDGVPAKTIGKP